MPYPYRPVCEDAHGRLYRPLSKRETEVLLLAAAGLTGAEMAERLYVSRETVYYHLRNVYRNLGVSGAFAGADGVRLRAVVRALRLGLIRLEDIVDE